MNYIYDNCTIFSEGDVCLFDLPQWQSVKEFLRQSTGGHSHLRFLDRLRERGGFRLIGCSSDGRSLTLEDVWGNKMGLCWFHELERYQCVFGGTLFHMYTKYDLWEIIVELAHTARLLRTLGDIGIS